MCWPYKRTNIASQKQTQTVYTQKNIVVWKRQNFEQHKTMKNKHICTQEIWQLMSFSKLHYKPSQEIVNNFLINDNFTKITSQTFMALKKVNNRQRFSAKW